MPIYRDAQPAGFPRQPTMGHCRRSRRALSFSFRAIAMSTLTIQLPEGLANQLRECAVNEGVTVDQLLASAAAEKLSALLTVEHLPPRAVCQTRGFAFLTDWSGCQHGMGSCPHDDSRATVNLARTRNSWSASTSMACWSSPTSLTPAFHRRRPALGLPERARGGPSLSRAVR